MGAPAIPFGSGTDPLGLTNTDWEFISHDYTLKIDNEKMSVKNDGTFLRIVATRVKCEGTANYLRLANAAAVPALGLYDASAGGLARKVWLTGPTHGQPQEADQTLAVPYWYAADLGAAYREGLRANVMTPAEPTLADTIIPFGPGSDPLALAAADFEFVAWNRTDAIGNDTMSLQAIGTFLRQAATRARRDYTANYIILDLTAALPNLGLYQYAADPAKYVWVPSMTVSRPQEGDTTLAVTYSTFEDIVATEYDRDDFPA